ncbi:hypothetical protein HK097_002466 [Rhizophlyctis rosea]|uniref:Uncharacterized protein n=1 Tax=Rhizophlyctis rosea TaxID=64517 RepID=A0AAD5X058_9FUNG|nr:hypothetical protein HK097_002466 [Rhizophlyctis rosea]
MRVDYKLLERTVRAGNTEAFQLLYPSTLSVRPLNPLIADVIVELKRVEIFEYLLDRLHGSDKLSFRPRGTDQILNLLILSCFEHYNINMFHMLLSKANGTPSQKYLKYYWMRLMDVERYTTQPEDCMPAFMQFREWLGSLLHLQSMEELMGSIYDVITDEVIPHGMYDALERDNSALLVLFGDQLRYLVDRGAGFDSRHRYLEHVLEWDRNLFTHLVTKQNAAEALRVALKAQDSEVVAYVRRVMNS